MIEILIEEIEQRSLGNCCLAQVLLPDPRTPNRKKLFRGVLNKRG
jgi:hypothetical protein